MGTTKVEVSDEDYRGIMNKIATYLNGHLLGEASAAKNMRRRYSRDASILTVTPEIVVFPKTTNDIRKTARFSWQLAEKGHVVPLTPRGFGADTTGAAIGKGVVIDMSAHLHHILTASPKDKLIHVQPGVSVQTMNDVLRWQGQSIPDISSDSCHTSIGGAIAGGSMGDISRLADIVDKLEVILANGDVIETKRLNKGEVSKKLGLQTFEGELYRKVAGLIEDNQALLDAEITKEALDLAGYPGLALVKEKDGSMDLTPLFIGSQGTLGIISEIVLKTEFTPVDSRFVAVKVATHEVAWDLSDRIIELRPRRLVGVEASLLRLAEKIGKTYPHFGSFDDDSVIVVVEFKDFSDRARQNKVKKLRKMLEKMTLPYIDSLDTEASLFEQVLDIVPAIQRSSEPDQQLLPILEGLAIPVSRREEHARYMAELGKKHHVDLPCIQNYLTGVVSYYPHLELDVVSDKQKLFRLLHDVSEAAHRVGGDFVADGAEGRLKAPAAWSQLSAELRSTYQQLRTIFDPFETLNPGVKQPVDLRTVVAALRSEWDVTDTVS